MREFALATDNYTEPLREFAFPRYPRQLGLRHRGRDLITLLINSMAAFALSKYEFKGRTPPC